MMKHMLQRLFAEIMVKIPAHKLIVEYPEMMYSLLQTSVALILQFFLALGMWAWHHFPQLSESRCGWSKETSRTVAPWGEGRTHSTCLKKCGLFAWQNQMQVSSKDWTSKLLAWFPGWSHLQSAVCQHREGRPGRFGHVQWHQIDRG